MLPVNYRSWQRIFSKLSKPFQQWELTFLSTVAFRAAKTPPTLRVDVPVAIAATKNLEYTMLPVNYWSWQRSFSKLPKTCQQWELTFLLTVDFRATKIPTTFRDDFPEAIAATKNLEGTMFPLNYRSWQSSFSELPKTCQQWELTFLSTVAFWATKLLTTFRVEFLVVFRATLNLEGTTLPANCQGWKL